MYVYVYMCMYACKHVYIYMALGSSPELLVITEGVQLNLYQPLCMLSRTFWHTHMHLNLFSYWVNRIHMYITLGGEEQLSNIG